MHIYWTNFKLPNILSTRKPPSLRANGKSRDSAKEMAIFHEIDYYAYKGKQDRAKMARNLVDYEAGKTILETALGVISQSKSNQTSIF